MTWRQRVQGVVVVLLVLGALAIAAGAGWAPTWTDTWTDQWLPMGW